MPDIIAAAANASMAAKTRFIVPLPLVPEKLPPVEGRDKREDGAALRRPAFR
ncbi:hypothetical protein GCM10009095_23870 [Sphingomonas molluscorum]|nr:hypothetical protein GCM10017606_06930 [Microbacterium terregens]